MFLGDTRILDDPIYFKYGTDMIQNYYMCILRAGVQVVVKHLPSMCEGLGLLSSVNKQQRKSHFPPENSSE